MIDASTTRQKLAAIVVKKLEEHGLSAVLVGGAVVSIYTAGKYDSHDLDFISPNDHSLIAKAIGELGFIPDGRSFAHPDTEFTVEFPSGPIAIGDLQPVTPEGELIVDGTKIILLSPTQSTMDRLAWFYHLSDRQCLDQAVMIASAQTVNLQKIKAWSISEHSLEKYELFLGRLKAAKQGKK